MTNQPACNARAMRTGSAEHTQFARARPLEIPQRAFKLMLPLFRAAQAAKPVASGGGVQTCSHRRKAPGRSHQPRGGCRGTPSPSKLRLIKAAQGRNCFSAVIGLPRGHNKLRTIHEICARLLATLGGSVGRVCGTHGHFCKGRRRKREFGFRDIHQDHCDHGCTWSHFSRHRTMAIARSGLRAKLLLSRPFRPRHRRLLGLLFPRPQTGRRRARRADRQDERRARRDFRRHIPGRTPFDS
jgi:hypothetical protein